MASDCIIKPGENTLKSLKKEAILVFLCCLNGHPGHVSLKHYYTPAEAEDLHFQREQQQILPSPLDSSVALASVMFGKYGLIRSSIVTVARELKAEEMVLAGQKQD